MKKIILLAAFLFFIISPRPVLAGCLQECIDQGIPGAECQEQCANSGSSTNSGGSTIFGKIPLPEPLENLGDVDSGGIGKFLNIIFKTIIVAAGVYSLFNLLIGGYGFLSAADDPKKVGAAWSRIWQTFLGLAFTAGAFVLAAIFGQVIFGKWDFILNPQIPTL